MRAPYTWLTLVALGLVLHEYAYKDFLVDDAFISFRYAENLVAGYGLVFNRIGDPVEGYTNFLWTLLFAGVLYLKLDPIIMAKVFGCLLSLLSLSLTYKISRRILVPITASCPLPTASERWALLPPVFLAVSGPFAAWAMGGLETQLVTALNLLALQQYLRELEIERGKEGERWTRFPFSVIFFTMAALTRPDAILFWGAVLVMHLFHKDRKRKSTRGYCLLPTAYYLLPMVGFSLFWLWRWQYYGDLLPNTYYMKTGGGLHQMMAGISYVLNHILSQGGLFPFLLFYFFRWKYGTYAHWLLLAQISFYVAFIILSGGDWMPLHRFLVPLLPLLAILNTAALRGLQQKLTLFLQKLNSSSTLPYSSHTPIPPHPHHPALLLYILISLIGLFLIFPLIETMVEHSTVIGDSEGVQSLVEFGKWLGGQVPPDTLIAVNPAGAIPYYSRLSTLDMTGLTDSHIAHLKMGGLHQKYDSRYILGHRPDFIVLIGRYDRKTRSYQATWVGEEDLFHRPEFQSTYQPVDHPIFKYKKDYQIVLFQRKP